jgi:hypothetical protein
MCRETMEMARIPVIPFQNIIMWFPGNKIGFLEHFYSILIKITGFV